jgi:ubiquinone/menaquinone biosynthesis C-methylase UbiE
MLKTTEENNLFSNYFSHVVKNYEKINNNLSANFRLKKNIFHKQYF